jgi:hypothetical protein
MVGYTAKKNQKDPFSASISTYHHNTTSQRTSWAFLAEKKHPVFSPAAAAETLHALKLFLELGK